MKAQIRKMDHTGDSVIATYDTESEEEAQVAQEALTEFLNECVEKFGSEPPVWGRRIGQKDFDMIHGAASDANLLQMEEVLMQYPLTGG